jgi:serine/threonine protein kinase
MGEVYRARDTRLGRDVALKILPETLAKDAERMARFQREAQVLASLNHPNIASIYGLEDSRGVRALVMELVEGVTLGERIAGAVGADFSPADETLSIAQQIAEALEYAHERGIIHRDMKPANVKITPEGTVKVLDFGLAKALDTNASRSSDSSDSPTLTAAETRAGVILGTAAYMSPEQARGKVVDRRADIWAFGCLLYEMLTGKKPFSGETVTDTLAAVIREEPDREALPANTPPKIRDVLYRCLKKDPKQRLRDVGDARIAIEETLRGGEDAVIYDRRPGDDTLPAQPRRRTTAWAAVATLTTVAVLGGWWLRGRHVAEPMHWSGDLLGGSSIAFGPRISPDGRTLAFQAMVDNQMQVAVLNPDSGNWTVLTHDRSRGTVQEIAWSPDGSKLYFDRVSSRRRGTAAAERRRKPGSPSRRQPGGLAD